MSHDSAKPAKISGGCLCQSIKYEILFDKNTPWPPPVSAQTRPNPVTSNFNLKSNQKVVTVGNLSMHNVP